MPARSSASTSSRDATATSAIASLPGGHVGEQLEHRVERVVVLVGALAAEQEDLGVEQLERELELLLVAHVDDELDRVVVRVTVRAEDDGVGVGRAGAADPQERQGRGLADAGDRVADRERFGALGLGDARAFHVGDANDDRDPVAFRDSLAEASWAGHLRDEA